MYAKLLKAVISISLILTALVASPVYAMQKILVFGDSLSAAYGLNDKTGWVYLLEQKLKALNYSAKVINSSISGETTAGGASKIAKTIAIHKPDIIIIELGGNDGLQGLSIASMRTNLEKIVNTAKQSNIKSLLVGMKIPPNYGIQYTKQFSETYKKIADEQNIAYIPFLLEGIGGNPLLMQSDGIHANKEAQPMILDNVWPGLKPLLKK